MFSDRFHFFNKTIMALESQWFAYERYFILNDCKSKGSCSNRRAESRSRRIQETAIIGRAEVSSATRTRTLDTRNRNCQVRSQRTSFSFNHGSRPAFVGTKSYAKSSASCQLRNSATRDRNKMSITSRRRPFDPQPRGARMAPTSVNNQRERTYC